MTKLQQRFRPVVWLVVLQIANVPIPFVHDHDSVCADAISIHLAARHQGDEETEGRHLHLFFLGPVCWASETPPGESPLEPGGPVRPNDHGAVAEVDSDVDVRFRLPLLVDSLQSPMRCGGVTDESQLADTRIITDCVGDRSWTTSASWQAVYSVMLI